MTKRISLILAICLLVSGVAYGRRIAWKNTDKPPVSLRLALTLASEFIEDEEEDYFCVGASIAKTFSNGDWLFQFSTKNGKLLQVNVGSDKKIKKFAHGFEY